MYRPPPRSNLEAYRYNPQAIEDHDDDHVREQKTRTDGRANRDNYRPTPLTVPFIVVLMVLFAAAIGLVVYVRQTKQDSDTTAKITTRQLDFFPHFPRQIVSNTTANTDRETSPVSIVPDSSTTLAVSTQISTPPTSSTSTDITTIPNKQTTATAAETSSVIEEGISTTPAKETTPSGPGTTTTPTQSPTKSALSSSSSSSSDDASETTSPQISAESIKPTVESPSQSFSQETTDGSISTVRSTAETGSGVSPTGSETPATSQKGTSGTPTSFHTTSITVTTSSEILTAPTTITTTVCDTSACYEDIIIKSPYTNTPTGLKDLPAGGTSSMVSGARAATTFTTSFTTLTTFTSTKGPSTVTSILGSSTSTGFRTTTVLTTETLTISPTGSQTRTRTGASVTTIVSSPRTTVIETTEHGHVTSFTSVIPPTTETQTVSPEPTTEPFIVTTTSGIVITEPSSTVLQGDTITITYAGTEVPVTTEVATQSVVVSYLGPGVSTITSRRTLSIIAVGQTPSVVGVPVTSVVVDGPSTATYVQTEAPTEVVTTENQVVTQVFTGGAQTYVSTVAGIATTIVGVTTLAGTGKPITYEVVSSIGGQLTTVVQEQAAQTFVSTIGGVVQTFVSTPPAQTYTSMIDGTLTTFVSQGQPQTIVSTIGGILTTVVTTPEPLTLTSMIGGTLTTMTMVSTPTGDIVSSYTLTTTFGESLTTIVSTPSPSTFVTTISGKLTTFTSTPSPTTITSTFSASSHTTTFTSSATTAPDGGKNGTQVIVQETIQAFSFTKAEYFAGKFLPALLAIMLAIPLRIIDMNAKLYQPFHAMAQPTGAYGGDSMTLQYSGLKGFITPAVTLVQGYPVPFISTIAVFASSFIVPLATEAIGIKLHGECKIDSVSGCAGALGVSPNISIILITLLGFIIILLALLLFFLRKYKTGLYSNPWSIAGMSSIATNPDIRLRGASDADIKRELAEKRFGLGTFENKGGQDDYGIVLVDESGRQLTDGDDDHTSLNGMEDGGGETNPAAGDKRHSVPFMVLTFTWRVLLIFVLLGMFGLVLYYHLSHNEDTPLTRWILGQDFGVRFVFAGMGVVIAFGWTAFFLGVAIASPFYTMYSRSQPPEKSILLTRPTNSVFGLYTAIKRADWFLILVSFLAILNEFLPILLANVPYTLTQTKETHIICSRFAMAILVADAVTLFGSLFINWPHMPADPRNVAGAIYYVLESRMLIDFEGTSRMERKERDRWLREKGRRYFYGEVLGARSSSRMAVEGDAVSGAGIRGLGAVKTEYGGHGGV